MSRLFFNFALSSLLGSIFFFSAFSLALSSDQAKNALDSATELRADFGGVIGARVDDLVDNWTLRAPKANPILLNVFQLRDREPQTDSYYVPWIGEFAGKYLTNSILLMQMNDSKELPPTVDAVVRALIASQDKSGYIGPFPRDRRLLVGWDLWGHYHSIVALLLYYERTGSADALEAARRAGMFVCEHFVDAGKQVKDVGSDDMNFAIFSAMTKLYRVTGEERFWKAAQTFLSELNNFGDFYRLGLKGVDFYATPRPRWEPLHTIEGFADVYRITGDESYKRALLAHWESILTRDVHVNGSFSTNEQAVGTPYQKGPIETCCTVSWIALTLEALRLTGDVRCADALENSLYNAVAAYEHPSGSWCCYDSPLNGRREASFHSIVFQSRPGQPELNCCSVNGPRGFAELVDWSAMKGREENGSESLYLNYYGESSLELRLNGTPVRIVQKTSYPVDGHIEIAIEPVEGEIFDAPVYLRVPAWTNGATLTTPEAAKPISLTSGGYFRVERQWRKGESIALDIPMTFRTETASGDFDGRFSVFRGPILLAYDQTFNQREEAGLPTVDPTAFDNAEVETLTSNPTAERIGYYSPWLFVKVDGTNGEPIFLTDYAWAGSLGATYASLLRGEHLAPSVPFCSQPVRGAAVPTGALLFQWKGENDSASTRYTVQVGTAPDFAFPLFEVVSTNETDALATAEQTSVLTPNTTYYWRVVAENEFGRATSLGSRAFVVDSSLPQFDADSYLAKERAKRETTALVVDALNGEPKPSVGELENVCNVLPARGKNDEENGAVELNGENSEIIYRLDEFPRVDYEATLDFALEGIPTSEYAELLSAWTKGNDDPLRVAVDNEGRLYGAIEGLKDGMTPRVKLEENKWYRLRVVKTGANWTIALDDEVIGSLETESSMTTDSTAIGIGCNPKYRSTPEFLKCKIANFVLKGKCRE